MDTWDWDWVFWQEEGNDCLRNGHLFLLRILDPGIDDPCRFKLPVIVFFPFRIRSLLAGTREMLNEQRELVSSSSLRFVNATHLDK